MTIAAKGSSPPALQVKLSADGMASIASSKMENDFRFVVGERDYPCPWFLADFISPKIGRLHASEPSLSEFVIATPDSGQHFGEILSAGRGASLSVTEVNRPFLVSVAAELENVELYWLLNDPAKDGATVSEFCERFCESAFPETATTQSIEFIASHFFEMDQSFLAALPLSTLDRVLSDAGVLLESEDHLCEIVLMRLKTESESESESGSASVGLLGHVRFELLTVEKVGELISWSCDNFDKFTISYEMWIRLCGRLRFGVFPEAADGRVLHRSFFPSAEGSLDGIIAYLSRESGGNVHDRTIVELTAKTVYGSYVGKNAVDLKSDNYYESEDKPDQWICFNFKDRRVRPSHYSIHAHSSNWWLRSWVLEGSEDNSKWTVLDEQTGNDRTNSSHPIGTFAVSRSSPCQWIRLRQTGKNVQGSDHLILFAVELFGELIERQSVTK